ncbi:MAG: hypothetical protein JWN93_480 [Hyphomicrobiales bacterium]|nr:hypothetical protein [Hyphomicrobiales bacterium]
MKRHAALMVLGAFLLAAAPARASDKANQPAPTATMALMAAKNMAPSAPILIRTYKKEAMLEVWKQTRGGRYALLKSFPICRWSGQLGPKVKQGDRQTPEGFYAISPKQLNPNSSYYLSFDIGFPNAYDRAHGASGSYLMVHGSCSSAGCYAMTDAQVAEIYALARDALAGGQGAFQFQAYPFRMTAENIAKHRSDPHIAFWRQLKEGADVFEATGEEPRVSVNGGRYAFAARTPEAETAASARKAAEAARIATLIAEGGAAIRTTYSDGGQNAIFAALRDKGANLGEISRPEALAYAGREVTLIPARRKPVVAAAPAAEHKPVPVAQAPAAAQTPAAEKPAPFATMPGAAPILEPVFKIAAAASAQS